MDSRLGQHPGLDFLTAEIHTGLTFAKLASTALPGETDKAARNRGNARTAYDTVLKFRDRVKLNEKQNRELDDGLRRLHSVLMELGENI